MREELVAALAEGRNVTAKIKWLNRFDDEGRSRWIHCTPLIGSNGAVGSWMVVMVDDAREIERKRMGVEAGIGMGFGMGGRWRQAPAVDSNIGSSRERDDQSIIRMHKHLAGDTGSGSQAGWPLRDDSQSLDGSVTSFAQMSDGQRLEEQAGLRSGPHRDRTAETYSPRAEPRVAVRFKPRSNPSCRQSPERGLRAVASKEKVGREVYPGSGNRSRVTDGGGSRGRSRTGSPGKGYAF